MAKKKTQLKKDADAMYKAMKKARETATAFITDAVNNNGGRIEFDSENDGEYISVAYDGGNHPEYASNVFSTVYGVYMHRNGYPVLETEDCSEYDLTNVDTVDVVNIAETIEDFVLPRLAEEGD